MRVNYQTPTSMYVLDYDDKVVGHAVQRSNKRWSAYSIQLEQLHSNDISFESEQDVVEFFKLAHKGLNTNKET